MSNQNIAPLRPTMTAAGMIGLPVAIQIPQSHQSAPFNNNNSYSSAPHSSSSQLLRPPSENGQDGTQRKKGGVTGGSTPYIPSYMDLTNGPEPCVVCSDAATGYHYRCMTCEGCKGFFRRTIQKNLKYHCKWNGQCVIDKNTRNQCQQCRFNKCLAVGMATDLVLNEKQRIAKRKLIEENRERRRRDMETATMPNQVGLSSISSGASVSPSGSSTSVQSSSSSLSSLREPDAYLISSIVQAFEKSAASAKVNEPLSPSVAMETEDNSNKMWQQLAEVITPSIVKVVDFAKNVPGFEMLNLDDRILLLKSCCMEIMCLRAACRYNNSDQSLTLANGYKLYKNQLSEISHYGVSMLMVPIFEFAKSISRLDLDSTEVAMLAAVLLMQSDRTGLKNSLEVEKLLETILGAFNRYVCEQRKHSLGRWATILMKVTDLRTISTRHAERVLAVKLDKPTEIPPFFFEMFDEGDNNHMLMASLSPQKNTSPLISPYLKSPGIPSLFSPLALQRVPSLSDFHALTSPILRTPNLLTTVQPFWSNPNFLGLPSLPPTPKTPVAPEKVELSAVPVSSCTINSTITSTSTTDI